MSTLLAIGLANAICAALLAVPAFLASRYGRRPALAHALWLLVLLKLVTPPLFRPPLAWLPAEEEPAPVAAAPIKEPTAAPVASTPFTFMVEPVANQQVVARVIEPAQPGLPREIVVTPATSIEATPPPPQP